MQRELHGMRRRHWLRVSLEPETHCGVDGVLVGPDEHQGRVRLHGFWHRGVHGYVDPDDERRSRRDRSFGLVHVRVWLYRFRRSILRHQQHHGAKKNPHGLMYVTENISKLLGRMTGAIVQYRNVSGLGSLKEVGFSFELTARSLRAMSGIMTSMKVKSDRMRHQSTAAWAQSSDLAGAMVSEKGLPWRTAYQIVAILVRQSMEEGKGEHDVTPEMVDRAAIEYSGKPIGLSAQEIKKALDPLECVKARTLIGGPAPDQVKKQIEESRQALLADQQIFEELLGQVKAGETKMAEAERALLS